MSRLTAGCGGRTAPYLTLLAVSLSTSWGLQFWQNLTLAHYRFVLFEYDVTRRAIANSLLLASAAATLSVLLGSLEGLDRPAHPAAGPEGAGLRVADPAGPARDRRGGGADPDLAPRRGMGMVFQNYAVWPHKTVFQNVAFGLEVRRVGKARTRERVARVLELVSLAGLESRYPGQLSGGQQQRVALARSLVVEPGILLLDEPLSNLDAKLRERMRWELKDLQRRTGIAFVYVTHDQAEAMALSDRIAVMHQGEVMQYGPPREVYTRPASRIVADFMGLVNLLPGRVLRAAGDDSQVAVGGEHPVPLTLPSRIAAGQAVQVGIRPESLRLTALGPGASPAPGAVPGKVADVTFLGNLIDCHVTLDDGTRIRVQASPSEALEVGQRVGVVVDSQAVSVFEA